MNTHRHPKPKISFRYQLAALGMEIDRLTQAGDTSGRITLLEKMRQSLEARRAQA